MNTAALIALFLVANEPLTIDQAARAERMREGKPIQQSTYDSAMLTRARDAHASVAARVLACYHPTAKLSAYQAQGYWQPAWEYGADHSQVYNIEYSGISGTRYRMTVAITARLDDVNIHNATARTFLIYDNAMIPANDRCPLHAGQKPDFAGI